MCSTQQLHALVLAVILTGALPACAVYRKCGFAGCPGDAKITGEVLALLKQYPSLEAPNTVRVQTTDRIVYLNGQVNTELERSMAESVALAIPNVRRVVNSISLNDVGR
jgi:osmotically-inducible protein OsmY